MDVQVSYSRKMNEEDMKQGIFGANKIRKLLAKYKNIILVITKWMENLKYINILF